MATPNNPTPQPAPKPRPVAYVADGKGCVEGLPAWMVDDREDHLGGWEDWREDPNGWER